MTLVPMLAAGKPEYEVPDPDRSPGRLGRGIARALAGKRRLTTRVSDFMAWLFGFLARPTQSGFAAVQRAYLPALRWSLENRGRVVAVSVAILLLTAALVPRLGSELIPQLSQGEFIADLRLAPGTPLEQTDRAMAVAQSEAMELPGIALSYAVTGTGNRLDASPTDAGENTGRLSVTLRAGHGRGRGTGRDHRAARPVRGARRRAVPVQPPRAVQLLLAARGHDHRLRPRPPAPGRRTGAPRHAGEPDVQRHQVDGRGRQSRDPDRVRPGARGPARHLRARARRPRGRERARRRRDPLQAAREEDRRAGPQRRHARVLGRGDPLADRQSRQRPPAAAVRGRRSHGRDRPGRDPPHPPAARGDRLGEPVGRRPRLGGRRAQRRSSRRSTCRSA